MAALLTAWHRQPSEVMMEDVQRAQLLLEQIKKERQSGVLFKRITTYSILAMFLLFFGSIYMRVQSFDGERFVVELQNRAVTTVWPVTARELDGITADAIPAITDALQEEAEQLIPSLSEKLMSESAIFQQRIGEQLKTSLESHFLAQLERHKDALGSENSRFMGQNSSVFEDMMRRLEVSSRLWAQDTLDQVFNDHIIVLQSINETVKGLQEKARGDLETGQRDNLDDVLLLLIDILNSSVDGEK